MRLFLFCFLCLFTFSAPALAVEKGNHPPVTPQGNTDKHVAPVGRPAAEITEAQRIGDAYAVHLYTSVCVQNYQYRFPLFRMKGEQRAQFYKLAPKACRCMAEEALKVGSGANLVDYVMYFYGQKPSLDQFSPEAKAYMTTEGYLAVGDVENDPGVLKKCGFIE